MQTLKETKHFALVFLLLLLVQCSLQQTCTSLLFSEKESNIPSEGECPIGYVNSGAKCQLFTPFYKDMKSASCSSGGSCFFASMDCYNKQICIPKLRLPGDSCITDSQCLRDIPLYSATNMADLVGPKCINGKCSKFRVERRNDGETCKIDMDSKIVYDCQDGSTCYKCCAAVGQTSKCVRKVKVKKGESCSNINSIDDPPLQQRICDSGLYCKLELDGKQICTERTLKGGACSSTDTCEEGLVCRQNPNSNNTSTCQKISSYGESCSQPTDCAFYNSLVVDCVNNKCQRRYGIPLGGICKHDNECYTSYCSLSEGKCAQRPDITCFNNAPCEMGASCACGGRATSSSSGKCTSSCYGPMNDVFACIYNLGVTFSDGVNYFVGKDYYQFADQDSSVFTKCRYAYNRYYSCMRKSWENAGITLNKGDIMDGVDFNSYSIDASPILPERSGAVYSSVLAVVNMIVVIVVGSLLI